MKAKKILRICFILLFLYVQVGHTQTPKYIFYFIGDGFGLSQSMLAENFLDATARDTQTVHLHLWDLPEMGLSTTYSANSFVTCSSAAGTALATGVKTNNNMLGVTPQQQPLTSIAKFLHKQGFLIGLISSVSIDHATPAAFYANVSSRNSYKDVALQLPTAGFEFLGGGGLKGAQNAPEIWDSLKKQGYFISNNPSEIKKHTFDKGKIYAISSNLCGEQDIPFRLEEPQHPMHLSYFVTQMIRIFEPTNKPFFAMIEGGKIDWAAHYNDAAATLYEVIEMDSAFQIAYQFYLRHPNETLIIITADHETGGLSIGTEAKGYACQPELLTYQKQSIYTFRSHIKTLTRKSYTLQEIYTALNEQFSFDKHSDLALTQKDSAQINLFYKMQTDSLISNTPEYQNWKLTAPNSWSDLGNQIFCNKIGLGWTTGSHTGVAVPVRTIGVGTKYFRGSYTNSDIPLKILKALNLPTTLN